MNKLPFGWRSTTVGGLGKWVGGGTPSKAVERYWRGGTIPWVSPKDMKVTALGDTTDKITKEAVENSTTRIVPSGSILIVTRSGILAHSLPVAVTLAPVAINQDLRALLPEEGVDCNFICLWIRAHANFILADCAKAGTTVANINLDRLATYPIDLPPLAEQRRIVARIEALFARTRRARADLERIAPLAQRYVEAETERAFAAKLDAGWLMTTAGELAEIKSGITLGKRHPDSAQLVDRPYLRVANVQRGHLRLDEIKTIRVTQADASRLSLCVGDILMNEGGDRDKLGRGWVWEGQIENCIHQNHVFRLRLRSAAITPRFLSRYANHAGARYFLDEGKQTTNLASISMGKIAALPVPLPPPGVAETVDKRLDLTEAAAAVLRREAARTLALLDRLEQSILARAFRGELVARNQVDTADPMAAPPSLPAARRRTHGEGDAQPPDGRHHVGSH